MPFMPGSEIKILVLQAPREYPPLDCMFSFENLCREAFLNGIKTIPLRVTGAHNYGFWCFCDGMDYALAHGCTHLFLSADDMKFAERTLCRLVQDDKDIVGGFYCKRGDDGEPSPACFISDPENYQKYIDEEALVQTEFMSGHAALIKIHVLQEMAKKYPELEWVDEKGKSHSLLTMPMLRDKRLYLDDFAFSLRAREAGFECWLDFGVNCSHKIGGFARMNKTKKEVVPCLQPVTK